MASLYHHNHYVPVWYQKRFIPKDQKDRELYYLDLKPGSLSDPTGIRHELNGLHRWGPKYCFAQKDLYTTYFGSEESTRIEQEFFGPVDQNGKKGVEYFTDFTHPSVDYDALRSMMIYLCTQKLRTPKGLEWLKDQAETTDHEGILRLMLRLRDIFSAIWMECVWQIADSERSNTKFIFSDHPVTVYNRRCGPRSDWCRGNKDPDIRFQGTHTLFPLSLEKILILTNGSWVRNPYQSAIDVRPNPNLIRGAVFNYTKVQTLRHLTEQEVRQINFIIKSRSLRYVAAAKKEWLDPDLYVSKSQWNEFGDGYLLMPDPRPIYQGGEIFLGYSDGTVSAFDEYGRTPEDRDYKKESQNRTEANSLDRFKGEFARLYGPHRRGLTFQEVEGGKDRDDDKYHQYHLDLEKKAARRVRSTT